MSTVNKPGFYFILMICSLLGCTSQQFDDLEEYTAVIKAREAKPIEPLPFIEAYESFVYDGEALRDPFDSITEIFVVAEIEEGTGPGPDLERVKEELEAYPLDTLRMVGILAKGPDLWALIKASDGVIHRVQEGNYLGQNFGKISQVTKEEIKIDEFVSMNTGRWRERQASLVLAE